MIMIQIKAMSPLLTAMGPIKNSFLHRWCSSEHNYWSSGPTEMHYVTLKMCDIIAPRMTPAPVITFKWRCLSV